MCVWMLRMDVVWVWVSMGQLMGSVLCPTGKLCGMNLLRRVLCKLGMRH